MSAIQGLFEKRTADDPEVVSIDCLPGVKISIIAPTPKEIDKKRDRAMGRKNVFDTMKFRRSIILDAVKGWTGLTPRKALRIMPTMKAGPDFEDYADEEIDFSRQMLELLITNSEEFGRELVALFIDSDEIEEAREEAMRAAEELEEEEKNSPSSADGGSAERRSAPKSERSTDAQTRDS